MYYKVVGDPLWILTVFELVEYVKTSCIIFIYDVSQVVLNTYMLILNIKLYNYNYL